jgi:hypothetical protein
MMTSGFKPVGWVAAVAGAAIGCYMLSLNVASERSDLLKIEHEIIATKQDIRTLQTELGTRGRLAQLEQWNADVLALSAPAPGQFLDNEVKLARFDRRGPSLDEQAEVRMASAQVEQAPARKMEAPVVQAAAPQASAIPSPRSSLLHQASFSVPGSKLPQAQPIPASTPRAAVTAKAQGPVKAGTHKQSELPGLVPKARPTAIAAAGPAPGRSATATKAAKPSRPASRIDSSLANDIRAAAKLEAGRKTR